MKVGLKMKISLKERYSFGLGAFGKDAMLGLAGSFFTYYLTDGLYLSPIFVGGLFFVTRIIGTFVDLLMGIIVDNTHVKMGRFHFWLLIGMICSSLTFLLMYTPLSWSKSTLMIYIAILYLLFDISYTILDIPYWSWLPSLTSDPIEREKVSVLPRIFGTLAALVIAVLGLPMIRKIGQQQIALGFQRTSWIITAVFLLFMFLTWFNVPEPTEHVKVTKPKFHLRDLVTLIKNNDQLQIFIFILFSFNIGVQIFNQTTLYYFKYVVQNEWFFSAFAFNMLVEMAGLACFPLFSQKFHREKTFTFACVLMFCGYLILLWSGIYFAQNILFIMLAGTVLKFGKGLCIGMLTVALADCVDYNEWKTGVRNSGIIYSFQILLMKGAQALASLAIGWGLQLIHYQPNTIPTSNATNGIRLFTCVLPGVFLVLSWWLFHSVYRLKGERLVALSQQMEKMNHVKKV